MSTVALIFLLLVPPLTALAVLLVLILRLGRHAAPSDTDILKWRGERWNAAKLSVLGFALTITLLAVAHETLPPVVFTASPAVICFAVGIWLVLHRRRRRGLGGRLS